MSNSYNKLSEILRYYIQTRGAGHTSSIMDGLANVDDKVFLLCSNMNHARDLSKRNIENIIPLSWSSFPSHRLRGVKFPMAIDNSAIMSILQESVSEIEHVYGLFNTEKNRADKLADDVRDLQEIVFVLKAELWNSRPFKKILKSISNFFKRA